MCLVSASRTYRLLFRKLLKYRQFSFFYSLFDPLSFCRPIMALPAFPAKAADFDVPFAAFILLESEPDTKKTGAGKNVLHLFRLDAKLFANIKVILRWHDADFLSRPAKIINPLNGPVSPSAFEAGEKIRVVMKPADNAWMKCKNYFRRIAYDIAFQKCGICNPLLHLLAG